MIYFGKKRFKIMSDPATLKDCPFCEGTYWPDDRYCSFCKKELWTVQRIKQEEEENKYQKEEYKKYLREEEINCNLCHKEITDKQEYSIFFDGKKDTIGHVNCIKDG